MKVISAVVPCYNSEAYMEKAIQTLLTGGNDMEILVVDELGLEEDYKALYYALLSVVFLYKEYIGLFIIKSNSPINSVYSPPSLFLNK